MKGINIKSQLETIIAIGELLAWLSTPYTADNQKQWAGQGAR
ncbi:hypothetical protein ymoll0001_29010 [Yersinia mollaretii ATCC 43969]|uniref:Uncharacterized protein n=1 Tax=Yersinia mollaretii (strain ATCC 43969 / DSM 18520 / CIP 103324 / CNY 7263 / WAIP 204) TaxID=349967 RepID=A0ABM9YBC9_YERMW|nr:hypothetical protein ymoll0001_29010 [Yersinia mollaretii ATCC 43969]